MASRGFPREKSDVGGIARELVRPVGEAEAAGIPSMGLLNTSGNPNTLTYLIPANDNSIEVVGLFLMLVKKAIASGKAKRKVLLKRKSLIAKKAADRLKLKGNSQNKPSGRTLAVKVVAQSQPL